MEAELSDACLMFSADGHERQQNYRTSNHRINQTVYTNARQPNNVYNSRRIGLNERNQWVSIPRLDNTSPTHST